MDLLELFTQVQRFGFEYVFKRYPGVYEANVTDVRDPEKRGRIRALAVGIGAREPSQRWFTPAFLQAGANRGWFTPPSLGDSVLVTFENGDPSRPHRYFGGWYGNPSNTPEVPTELGYDTANPPNPRRTGFVSRLGHALIFNETPGEEAVELRWHQPRSGDPALTDPSKTADRSAGKTSTLKFLKDGTVTLLSAGDHEVTLDAAGAKVTVRDANGNTAVLDASGVTVTTKSGGVLNLIANQVKVKAASILLGDQAVVKAVLGEPLLAWLRAHTHGSGTGPTSPPLAPPPETLLSNVVKLK